MNVKNIFKILQVHVMTGRYGKRLGKTDEIASTLIVKLNAKSLVASDIRMWKSMNFKWNQLLCFLFLSLFLILWQQSTIWEWGGESKQNAGLEIKNGWMSLGEGIEGPREGSPGNGRKISCSLRGHDGRKNYDEPEETRSQCR